MVAAAQPIKSRSRNMPAHAGADVPWRKRAAKAGGHGYVYGSYVDELLATQTSAGTSDISGYTQCANEGQAFALPSTCDVAYGANGSFAFRVAQSGTITFNNATFGDPIPGVAKKGYYRLSGGQRFYAHANHLYSVAAITNSAGAVVERYRYSTFGERTVLAPDGITTRAVSSYNQQVGFTGRYEDKESKLLYFRARYYSGSLGRFISRDPWRMSYKKPNAKDGYPDGYNLYHAAFIPGKLDPKGTDCVPGTKSDFKITKVTITGANQGYSPKQLEDLHGVVNGLEHLAHAQAIVATAGAAIAGEAEAAVAEALAGVADALMGATAHGDLHTINEITEKDKQRGVKAWVKYEWNCCVTETTCLFFTSNVKQPRSGWATSVIDHPTGWAYNGEGIRDATKAALKQADVDYAAATCP